MHSSEIQAILEPIIPHILDKARTRGLIALAVVGSAARGEETWHDGKLIGDIDLAAVVHVPDLFTLNRFQIPKTVLGENISIGVLPLYSIKRYRTLEFYEAKETAWVLWGKQNVFNYVRIKGPNDIPKWEGIRLILNRVMECLRARLGLLPRWYAAVKCFLALGEADLVFSGRYVPTYRGRWEQLEKAGEILGSKELFAHYQWASRVKLGSKGFTDVDGLEYEEFLLQGLVTLFSEYLECKVNVYQGIDRVSEKIVHPIHRLNSIFQHRKEPHSWIPFLKQDPAFIIWKSAVQVLRKDILVTNEEVKDLLLAWENTYQPLLV